MKPGSRGSIVVPILIITFGVGALLSAAGVAPGVDWIWTLGLAVAGILSLVGGIDKVTVVVGPFLLIASLLSVLRQTGRLSIAIEVPMLVIVFGVLMLVARVAPIPTPAWLRDDVPDEPKK